MLLPCESSDCFTVCCLLSCLLENQTCSVRQTPIWTGGYLLRDLSSFVFRLKDFLQDENSEKQFSLRGQGGEAPHSGRDEGQAQQ